MLRIVADQVMAKAVSSAVQFVKSFKITVTVEQAAQLIKNGFDDQPHLLECFSEDEILENAKTVLNRIA